MDVVELELMCPCGYENFERVVVQRKPHAPVVTDLRGVYRLQGGVLRSSA
jgi:hypothetical protein